VLLALVAVASSGHRSLSGGDGAAREPSSAFWDYLFSVSLAFGVVGAGLLAWMLARGQQSDPRLTRKLQFRGVFFLVAAMLLGVVIAQRIGDFRADSQRANESRERATTIGSRTRGSPDESYRPEFRWLPVLLLGGAALVTAAVLGARSRRRLAHEPSDEQLVEGLAELLDEALGDLRSEPDPRRAVIAAYARMERALAAYGLPRRRSEAPLEFLGRIWTELGVVPGARNLVFELTHLFERAKFSAHEIGPELKDEAIATLSGLRDELRREEE
jgi:hypothetical protein